MRLPIRKKKETEIGGGHIKKENTTYVRLVAMMLLKQRTGKDFN